VIDLDFEWLFCGGCLVADGSSKKKNKWRCGGGLMMVMGWLFFAGEDKENSCINSNE